MSAEFIQSLSLRPRGEKARGKIFSSVIVPKVSTGGSCTNLAFWRANSRHFYANVNMGKSCKVPDCRSKWRKDGLLKFHRFPKDAERQRCWISVSKVDGPHGIYSAWICDSHFITGRPKQIIFFLDLLTIESTCYMGFSSIISP